MTRHFIIAAAFFSLNAAIASPAAAGAPSPVPSVTYGGAVFHFYCASCHGADGSGHGPSTPALKISAPDLTRLTQQFGGVFPTAALLSLITGGSPSWLSGHGTREMPVWGPIFRAEPSNAETAKMKIDSVLLYLQSIQRSSP